MWRPKNWDNPYSGKWDVAHNMIHDKIIFEAGADAMLKLLREEPIALRQLQIFCKYTDVPLNENLITFKRIKGKVVFIPDEKEDED